MDSFAQKAQQARETLDLKRSQSVLGGGEKRQAAQHERGKMTARERLTYLLDPGSFQELDAFATHDCRDFGMDAKSFLGDGERKRTKTLAYQAMLRPEKNILASTQSSFRFQVLRKATKANIGQLTNSFNRWVQMSAEGKKEQQLPFSSHSRL